LQSLPKNGKIIKNIKEGVLLIMYYQNILPATFISRPNRFIAHCQIGDETVICHVKNTGRCKELLKPNCKVYLQHLPSPNRKTQYDLIAVEKMGVLFNIDSQAPNKAVGEWLPNFFGKDAIIRPEYTFGESRLDFYVELNDRRILMEVKGVTLERDGLALFPDAPTTRGVKHLQELTKAVKKGFDCYVVFVIQAKGVSSFHPNMETDPLFTTALQQAHQNGVQVFAFDCMVTPDSMKIDAPVPVILS
jgi:sugar fermentation stimulation protein A